MVDEENGTRAFDCLSQPVKDRLIGLAQDSLWEQALAGEAVGSGYVGADSPLVQGIAANLARQPAIVERVTAEVKATLAAGGAVGGDLGRAVPNLTNASAYTHQEGKPRGRG